MLVLSRKPNEKIIIGEHVTITVLKIRGNTVRLGIEAPREIPVVRGELSKTDVQKRIEPVTVEFKNNRDGSQDPGVALRIIRQESERELPEEPEPTRKTIPVNRMFEFVTQVSDSRKAGP